MATLRVVGTSAAVFFALCGSGIATETGDPKCVDQTQNKDPLCAKVDAPDPTCTPGKECTGGDNTIIKDRGICVYETAPVALPDATADNLVCRDVCNHKNNKQSFKVNATGSGEANFYNVAMENIVNEVRCGYNLKVQCPEVEGTSLCDVECTLGTMCTRAQMNRHTKTTTERINFGPERSICVLDTEANHRCEDVCDKTLDLEKVGLGTETSADGTDAVTVAEQRRNSLMLCPAKRTMTTVWIVCIVVVLCAICAAAYMKCKRGKKGGSAPSSSRYENEYMEDYAGQAEGYGEMPEPASPREDDWQMRQQQEDMLAQQEYEMQQQQMMPPEPPRMDSGRQSSAPRDLLDLNMSYRGAAQPPSPTAGYPPASSSMQIPGLSEPNLFASIKPLTMPPGQGSVAQGSVLMPSVSHVGYNSRATSMNQSHYTQVPPVFMTSTPAASPPTSLQAPAGVLGQTQTLQQGSLGTTQQNFFTTIARR